MSLQHETLEVLMCVPNEMEASIIVQRLIDYGIAATAVGGFTSGFKAEAPGDVAILVKHSELAHAKSLLATFQEAPFDDTATDFEEDETEEEENEEESPYEESDKKAGLKMLSQFLLLIDVLCIPLLLFGYLFTREPSLLACTFMAIVMLGLVLSLLRYADKR